MVDVKKKTSRHVNNIFNKVLTLKNKSTKALVVVS